MSDPTGLTCPRCRSPLAPERRAGVVVDACAGCGGVWLGSGELEPVVAATPPGTTPRALDPAVAYLRCPECQTVMNRQNFERFSGVILDVCGRHGTWADRGELEQMRAFLARGGMARRATKEAEERRLAASVDRWGTDRTARSVISSGAFTVEDVLVEILTDG